MVQRLRVVVALVALLLAVGGCGSGEAGGASASQASVESELAPDTTPVEPLGPGDCGQGPPAASLPDGARLLSDRQGERYCLGPPSLAGIVEVTTQVTVLGDHTVNPVFDAVGIGVFNELAGLCNLADPDPGLCPTGRLAIVVDDTVIAAPAINGPEFEADQIVISGAFSATEAADLTASLAGEGLLELRPVIAVLGPEPAS
jgi:hypothetical protein